MDMSALKINDDVLIDEEMETDRPLIGVEVNVDKKVAKDDKK